MQEKKFFREKENGIGWKCRSISRKNFREGIREGKITSKLAFLYRSGSHTNREKPGYWYTGTACKKQKQLTLKGPQGSGEAKP